MTEHLAFYLPRLYMNIQALSRFYIKKLSGLVVLAVDFFPKMI